MRSLLSPLPPFPHSSADNWIPQAWAFRKQRFLGDSRDLLLWVVTGVLWGLNKGERYPLFIRFSYHIDWTEPEFIIVQSSYQIISPVLWLSWLKMLSLFVSHQFLLWIRRVERSSIFCDLRFAAALRYRLGPDPIVPQRRLRARGLLNDRISLGLCHLFPIRCTIQVWYWSQHIPAVTTPIAHQSHFLLQQSSWTALKAPNSLNQKPHTWDSPNSLF